MECENCGSSVTTWESEGDSGYKCSNCGRVVENGVVFVEGLCKKELYYLRSGDLPLEENYHRSLD